MTSRYCFLITNKMKILTEEDEFGKYYMDSETGFYHREDGPAVEWRSGKKEWFFDGYQHRIDGPAVIYSDGTEEYWLHGKMHTKQEWEYEISLSPAERELRDLIN